MEMWFEYCQTHTTGYHPQDAFALISHTNDITSSLHSMETFMLIHCWWMLCQYGVILTEISSRIVLVLSCSCQCMTKSQHHPAQHWIHLSILLGYLVGSTLMTIKPSKKVIFENGAVIIIPLKRLLNHWAPGRTEWNLVSALQDGMRGNWWCLPKPQLDCGVFVTSVRRTFCH